MNKKLNTRWRKGAQRYSGDRTVETSHWVKEPTGGRRLVRKAVTEVMLVSHLHEQPGWHNGAKVRIT